MATQRPSVMAQARLRDERRLAGEENDDYEGFTREYRFLDVFTKKQGQLRIRLLGGLSFFAFVVGCWLVGVEMLSFNYEDMDMRDMIDDFRMTLRGNQDIHNNFFAPDTFNVRIRSGTRTTTAPGVRSTLATRKIFDPRIDWLLPAGNIPDTDYVNTWFTLSLAVESPVYSRKAVFESTLFRDFGGTPLQLSARNERWFQTESDWDADLSVIKRVSKMTFYVFNTGGTEYAFDRMNIQYEEIWRGTIRERDTVSADLVTASSGVFTLPVEVRDVAQPLQPVFPTPTGFTRALIGFLLLAIAFGTHVWWWYLQYALRRNAKQNQQQPPPFFAGWTKFRGW